MRRSFGCSVTIVLGVLRMRLLLLLLGGRRRALPHGLEQVGQRIRCARHVVLLCFGQMSENVAKVAMRKSKSTQKLARDVLDYRFSSDTPGMHRDVTALQMNRSGNRERHEKWFLC